MAEKPIVTFKLEGGEKLRAELRKLNPAQNQRIMVKSFRECGTLIAANARNEQIRRGGGAVHARKLTHRSFWLRNHISTDFRGLPRYCEIGAANVPYAAVHEQGGRRTIKAHTVRAHTRTSAFGRRTKAFTVPSYRVAAHTANFPKRPFLVPALDAIKPRIPGIIVKHWKREGAGR